ncbi:ABC transporter permease [Aestuariivirga sp.]|uniref:ABC transporter permease n=1 Tax=Aestuariivirga sp. TaxID=2650926 RepID=UPI0039E37D18
MKSGLSPRRPTLVAAAFALAFLIAPILVVIPVSFTPERYLSFPDGTLSLRHYQTALGDPVWLDAIETSLIVGLVSAAIATGLALLLAVGLWLRPSRWRFVLTGLAAIPLIAPQIVSGVVLYVADARLGLVATHAGLILAHTILAAPYAVIALGVGTARLDPALGRAAQSLGAGLWRTAWTVAVPNLRLPTAIAFGTAFAVSWEETVTTLLVSGASIATLPKRIWEGLRFNIDPAIAAISTLLIVLTVIIVLAARLISARVAREGSLRDDRPVPGHD